MKWWVPLLLSLMVIPGWSQSSDPANTRLFRTTVIREVLFDQAPLDEVMTFLREQTRQGDREVNIVISPEVNSSERRVTLNLRNAKAVDVFATVLQMTGTRAEVRRSIVWILPES
jgi:hypothetical protein